MDRAERIERIRAEFAALGRREEAQRHRGYDAGAAKALARERRALVARLERAANGLPESAPAQIVTREDRAAAIRAADWAAVRPGARIGGR